MSEREASNTDVYLSWSFLWSCLIFYWWGHPIDDQLGSLHGATSPGMRCDQILLKSLVKSSTSMDDGWVFSLLTMVLVIALVLRSSNISQFSSLRTSIAFIF
jgi:hypothetical protein